MTKRYGLGYDAPGPSTLEVVMYPPLTPYEKQTIDHIRSKSEILDSLSDAELANLYHHWSEITYSAGWMVDSTEGLISFIKWATTPPYLWKGS